MTPSPSAQLLRRLNASQTRRLSDERTAKDTAIEFGGYLATAAEAFMAEQNRAFETGNMPDNECWSALQSAIYEFRKRAERATP